MRTRARRVHPVPAPHVNREGRHVHSLEWRTHERPLVLRALVRSTSNFTWSSRLLHLLLEELHVSDDFDRLIGSVRRRRPTEYPQDIAVALVLRHSRCRQDLARTTKRLGLPGLAVATSSTLGPPALSTTQVVDARQALRPRGRRPVRD